MNKLLQKNELILLKATDIADILNVSRAMAYKIMQKGEIPTVRIGKSIRVRLSDLNAYIHNNLVSAKF